MQTITPGNKIRGAAVFAFDVSAVSQALNHFALR